MRVLLIMEQSVKGEAMNKVLLRWMLVCTLFVSAQRRVIQPPLITYLRQAYDTVLAYQPVDMGQLASDYYFICRRKGATTLFTYTNPFGRRLSGYHPPVIKQKFVQEDMRF